MLLLKLPCRSDAVPPPLGIAYLAAHLRDIADVKVLEGIRQRVTPASFARLADVWQADVVGFSVNTHAASTLHGYALAVRALCPDAFLVAGGAHPTALPDGTLQAAPALDCVLMGEAELSFRTLVEAVVAGNMARLEASELRTIPGLAFFDAGTFVQTPTAFVEDIDTFVMPAWDLVPPGDYPKAPHGAFARHFPVAPIITSRGCPYDCGFCSVPRLVGRKIRYRSAALVTDELRLLRDRFGIREFQIVDDNFTVHRGRAIAICEAIASNDLAMPWTCPNGVRVDTLDDELLDAMQAAGCYSISLGIESGSPAVLERMVKHLDLSVVPEVVARIVARGMEVHAFFILGYPGETPADVDETIRLAKALPLTRANFSLFTPLPGTSEYDALTAQDQHRILNLGDFAQVSFVPEGRSAAALKRQQRRALMEFYGRPSQLKRLARAVRTPEAGYHLARRAAHWLGSA